jgi:hypothetical protein
MEKLGQSGATPDPNMRREDCLVQPARIVERRRLPGARLIRIAEDPINDRQIVLLRQ